MNSGMSMTLHTDPITIHDDESPDLVEVAVKIKQLRDSGKQASNAHSRDIAEIQNDPQLNDQGRTERIAELKASHATQRRTAINAENEIIDNKITALERRLDGFVGHSSSDIIAYRDAQDRADAVDNGDRAAKLMDRALRSNDRTLAHALFRAAVDHKWVEAQRSFAKENSSIAAIVNDVQKLRDLRNTFGRGISYM